MTLGEEEQDKQPLSNVLITVRETEDNDLTNDGGLFRIRLSLPLKAGQEVELVHNKPDFAIHHPLFGKLRMPENELALVEVRMLPKSSKLFWTHQRIEQFIEHVANQSAQEVTPAGQMPRSDLSEYILKLGNEYGFTEAEVRQEIRGWLEAAKQQKTDFRKLGLAAFAEENFELAAENFLESARWNDTEAARDDELAGDAF